MKKETQNREERIRRASRQRREQEKEELRQLILKSAGELFLAHGYEHLSMRQIAEAIGYSVATLYLYFRDKDELLFTLLDDGFARYEHQLKQASVSSEEPWERLNALAEAYISFGLENPVYYQLMFLQRTDYLMQTRVGEQEARIESFSVLRDTVQYAIDKGAMRPGDAETYSDTLWAIMHGIVTMAITLPQFDEQRVEKLSHMARHLVFMALALP